MKNNAKVGATIAVALERNQNPQLQAKDVKLVDDDSILHGESSQPVIIGGAVVDLVAKSYAALIPHTKNPGYVTQHLGGVGRNIAEVLARLGQDPLFLSAIGNDWYAKMIQMESREIGLVHIYTFVFFFLSDYFVIYDFIPN